MVTEKELKTELLRMYEEHPCCTDSSLHSKLIREAEEEASDD